MGLDKDPASLLFKRQQPFLEQVTKLTEELIPIKEQLKKLKKDKADKAEIKKVEEAIKAQEKAIRDAENKASNIDAAVYDLKAVNPHVKAQVDTRTPVEIIDNIDKQGQIVATAMSNLRNMLDTSG